MKILKNTTLVTIGIIDTGISIPGNSSYTIPSQDYLLWAASSEVITHIGSGDIIVNDGSFDLSISDGVDLIKGLFPKTVLQGTSPWVTNDPDVEAILNLIASSLGSGVGDSRQYGVASPPSKIKTEFPASTYYATYTVPTGKKFRLKSMIGTYNFQAAITFYLERQVGGIGAWVEVQRIEMSQGTGSDPTLPLFFGNGTEIAQAGDKLRLAVEAAIAKGVATCSYSGDLI